MIKGRILLIAVSILSDKVLYAQSSKSVYEEKSIKQIDIKCPVSASTLRDSRQEKFIKQQNKLRAKHHK
jgi:hypothetical protein